jgi:hypothetical protein
MLGGHGLTYQMRIDQVDPRRLESGRSSASAIGLSDTGKSVPSSIFFPFPVRLVPWADHAL